MTADKYKSNLGWCEEGQTYCDVSEKAYKQGLKDAIEKCAEIMANHISCFECPLDCKEADIDSCAENLRLFLDNLMKGEAE